MHSALCDYYTNHSGGYRAGTKTVEGKTGRAVKFRRVQTSTPENKMLLRVEASVKQMCLQQTPKARIINCPQDAMNLAAFSTHAHWRHPGELRTIAFFACKISNANEISHKSPTIPHILEIGRIVSLVKNPCV